MVNAQDLLEDKDEVLDVLREEIQDDKLTHHGLHFLARHLLQNSKRTNPIPLGKTIVMNIDLVDIKAFLLELHPRLIPSIINKSTFEDIEPLPYHDISFPGIYLGRFLCDGQGLTFQQVEMIVQCLKDDRALNAALRAGLGVGVGIGQGVRNALKPFIRFWRDVLGQVAPTDVCIPQMLYVGWSDNPIQRQKGHKKCTSVF
jgi:hypothetical protein